MIQLSVIVMTSPEREDNLAACLQMLARQSLPALEVIIADDGSAGGQAVAAPFESALRLRYLWRPNEFCVARSRNLGAAAARSDWLVFLDSDMLFNPQALAAYASILKDFPARVLYGYFGNLRTAPSPSLFFPERQVLWCDRRFDAYRPKGLSPTPEMIHFPYQMAWSGHFAIHRKIFEQVQGFDERFRGWGSEDLDFAQRLFQAGHQLHFFLDAWAEQQLHPHDATFRPLPESERGASFVSSKQSASYTVQVLHSPQGWAALRDAVFGYYLQFAPKSSETGEYRLRHTPPASPDA